MTATTNTNEMIGGGEKATELHKIPTHASGKSHGRKRSEGGLFRSITGQSGVFSERRKSRYQNDSDEEDCDGPILSKAQSWALMPEVVEAQDRNKREGHLGRKLGVTWNNLTVRGVASGGVVNENYLSQFNLPQQFKEGRGKKELKTILDDCHGCVKPGEMLLALGRPGAGCTTLLKVSLIHSHSSTVCLLLT